LISIFFNFNIFVIIILEINSAKRFFSNLPLLVAPIRLTRLMKESTNLTDVTKGVDV
jgi:hypothetical protein